MRLYSPNDRRMMKTKEAKEISRTATDEGCTRYTLTSAAGVNLPLMNPQAVMPSTASTATATAIPARAEWTALAIRQLRTRNQLLGAARPKDNRSGKPIAQSMT